MEKRIVVRLPSDLHYKAKVKAAVTGKPMSVVCREALAAWVRENENKPGQPKG